MMAEWVLTVHDRGCVFKDPACIGEASLTRVGVESRKPA